MTTPSRHFPAPWRVVEDAAGQQLGTFYGRGDPELTMDEARRMAVNFAKLPELLQANESDQSAFTTARDADMSDKLAEFIERRNAKLDLSFVGPEVAAVFARFRVSTMADAAAMPEARQRQMGAQLLQAVLKQFDDAEAGNVRE
jgi:hypothetical protein